MQSLERWSQVVVDLAWGVPLVVLLVGGGLFLSIYARFLPLLHLKHGLEILLGKYDKADDPGQISHFQALSTALAATIGVGNIGGVSIAITQGGPGAVFWMWVAAVVGMATKYFTCTLAVLFRGTDSLGVLQGGPMYTIEVGLGKRFRFLALFFCLFGMIGCLPMFQTNQMAEILQDAYSVPPWLTGIACTLLVATVAFGGVQRIGTVTGRAVPAMVVIYLAMAIAVVAMNLDQVGSVFSSIFREAFTGSALAGGATGVGVRQVLIIGVKRAAFSNEAGIGTAPLAHGAAKTTEPVREGLVAMLGPFLDTLVVCTLTAVVVLTGSDYANATVSGVALTNEAVSASLGGFGQALLTLVVVLFAVTTMVSYSYYGRKCFAYLFGAERADLYSWIYLSGLFVGAIWSAQTVVNVVDSAFAMMAIPNMIATLILAPRVMEATRDYFARDRGAVPRGAEPRAAGPRGDGPETARS